MTAALEERATPPRPAADHGRTVRPRASWALTVVAILLGQMVVLLDVEVPVVRACVGLVVLLGLPVAVLMRRVRWQVDHWAVALVYAVTATVLGVLLGSLAINTVLPLVGLDRPLDRPVLVIVSTVADVLLVSWRRDVALVETDRFRRLVPTIARSRLEPAVVLGSAALALAVTGAIRLNNGAGGVVATVAHAAAVLALAVLMFRRGSVGRDVLVIYVVSAALLLGTSLRGWYITGHDIQREYIAFLLTNNADHWQMDRYQSAYNACLSVNVLPSVLAEMTGMSGTYVFKLLLQLLFALVPVAVYLFSRRLVDHRIALLATTFFVIFPTFFTDMPYLVRQEVAFLFLAGAVLAAGQTSWSMRTRRLAVIGLSIGVVLSHYSTTYLLLIGLLVGVAGVSVGSLTRWTRPRRLRRGARADRAALVLLSPVVVGAILASTWAWTGPATDSGGHFADTVRETTSTLLGRGDAESSSDVNYGLFSGQQPSPQQRFNQYVDESLADSDTDPSDRVLTDPLPDETRPELLARDVLPLTAAGSRLTAAGVDAESLNGAIRTLSAALFQVFLLVGAAAVLIRRRGARTVDRETFWLVMGSMVALGTVVVIPGLSAEYGVLRAFQQTLIVTAPVVAIGAVTLLGVLRSRAVSGAAVVTVLMGLSLTGVQPALLGGYFAQLSQSNSGLYYDLHYVTGAEVSAAQWLGTSVGGGSVQSEVISDKVAVSRLQTMVPSDVRVSGEFFPLALRKNSYVYLGAETVKRDRATIFYTGDLLTYRYPTEALDRKLDLVYSNPVSRIYR